MDWKERGRVPRTRPRAVAALRCSSTGSCGFRARIPSTFFIVRSEIPAVPFRISRKGRAHESDDPFVLRVDCSVAHGDGEVWFGLPEPASFLSPLTAQSGLFPIGPTLDE